MATSTASPPVPRKGSFMGMPINPSHGGAGTWMEGEEMCYPSGAMIRRCRAMCPDGVLRVVLCGIPDTAWTTPCKGGGYVDTKPESDAADAKHVFHYHPPGRFSVNGSGAYSRKVADAKAAEVFKATGVVVAVERVPTPRITAEQAQALAAFAKAHGRTWKQALRDAWMAGGFDKPRGEWIDGPLQALRNDMPSNAWLIRYRIAE